MAPLPSRCLHLGSAARACTIALTAAAAPALAAETPNPQGADNINNYLVGITGGAVSAAGLVGIDKGVTPIESAQDIIVALQPVLSSGSSRAAFGLTVTPARTTITPMAGATYASGNPLWRLLGGLTASYAQNGTKVGAVEYDKSAFALSTTYYLYKTDDPVIMANGAFAACARALLEADEKERPREIARIALDPTLTDKQRDEKLQALTKALNDKIVACQDPAVKALQEARWNSPRVSVSLGEGRIRNGTSGEARSLGQSLTANGQWGLGDFLLASTLRHTRKALDVGTLASATPAVNNASLVALRLTYGDQGSAALRALVEVSNSKKGSSAAYKDTFIYAVGIDKLIAPGSWLEIRIGRNRTLEAGKEQTTTLLNFNVSPTLFAFKK